MVSINEATRAFIAAREAAEAAAKALAKAEATLKESFVRTGIDHNIVGGQKVIIVRSLREKFDADALRNLVDGETFTKVTKVEVDAKRFRAAVTLGAVPAGVVDAVTKVTPVEAVRIYDIANEGAQGADLRLVESQVA